MGGVVTVIEGMIGAGKSTFAAELGEALGGRDRGVEVYPEPDDVGALNPWLALYYADPERYAFHTQIHLLHMRYRIHQLAQWHAMAVGHSVIDRPLYGDTAFLRLQHALGYISDLERDTYEMAARNMTLSVGAPPFAVKLCLDVDASLERIAGRAEARDGRKCETAIDRGYLEKLDVEIDRVLGTLEARGATVIRVDWNEPRTAEQRSGPIESIAAQIKGYRPIDGFDCAYGREIAGGF